MPSFNQTLHQASKSYLDIQITISTHHDQSFLVVVDSPAGDARGVMPPAFAQQERQAYLHHIRAYSLPVRPATAQAPSIQTFGQKLFEALFDDATLRSLYYESRGRAAEREQGLRLKLRILPPDLAVLPWELLYDPRFGEFVSLSHDTPLVRYPELPQSKSPLTVNGPLRVLGMIVSPYDLPPLNVEREKTLITNAVNDVQARVPIELTWLEGQTWQALQQALRRETWHIFHFIGHGGFDERQGEGYLALADHRGRAHLLFADELARLLDIQRASLRLVLLNACEGAVSNQLDLFSSTAATLMQKGIPSVLAMQNTITDQAAMQLAQTFYQSLADGLPVDVSMTEARNAMSLAVSKAEWGVPSLYMRSPNGVLFELESNQQAGKPFLPYEPQTVYVAAGPFLMGSPDGQEYHAAELPQHEVTLPAYRIGQYPVTNEEYAEFVKQTKHPVPQHISQKLWRGKKPPSNKLDHPVVGVNWYDALAYCQWLSEQTGRRYRLPTEAEWEKAARGTDARLYPWGNQWEPDYCNTGTKGTTPVTDYPEGKSPFDCFDMVGNVSEWTNTIWGHDPAESDFPYPYRADDGREALETEEHVNRIFRGGSFRDRKALLTCTTRRWYSPNRRDKRRGFRIVLELEK